MLLLVIQPSRYQLMYCAGNILGLKQLEHVLVDMSAILSDFFQVGRENVLRIALSGCCPTA